MKRFLLFVLGATVALASCQKIDENGITPAQSSLKVTAVIADNSTRVDYTVSDDNTVTPKWAVGDKIFGFTADGTFTFEVSGVSTSGTATFSNGGFAPADGTTLYAVYYPGKSVADFSNGELAVDVTSQSGSLNGTAPAIMCATATVEDGNVLFTFENQTAIIGVKKFQTNPAELITTFKASGLVATGTIKVDGGEFKLVPGTTPSDITIDCEYTADAEGMYDSPVYFVAVPTEGAVIDIKATSSKGTVGTYTTLTAVEAGSIEAGNYYYMSKKLASDHAARYTNDGGSNWTYTESLAEAISGIATTTAKEDATVELLKDDAIGAAELPSLAGKKFTLNGNDHTYDISARTKEFATDASTDVTFDDIVIDGKDNQSGKRFLYNNGNVTFADGAELKNVIFKNPSNAACGIIYNNSTGVLNINGAYIHDIKSMSAVTKGNVSGGFAANYGGVINMTSGTVENIACVGDTTLVRGAFAYNTYSNSIKAKINITGGTFKGLSSNCGGMIYTYAGDVNISNATISDCYSNNMAGAFFFYGSSSTYNTTVTIKNTTFDNCTAKGTAKGYAGLFAVSSNTTVTLDGCSISKCSSNTYGGAIAMLAGTLNIQNGTTITSCKAGTNGGSIYSEAGTVNMSGSNISSSSASTGGSFYIKGGTINVMENSVITGTNAYMTTAGTLNIDNSTYNYTGTGTALQVAGTSETANKGVINISNHSLIKSKGYDINAKWGKVTCTDSDFITSGSTACVYVNEGGDLTFTDSRGVNTNTGTNAAVFYSNTTKTSANLKVKSGYYSGNYIAQKGTGETYMCRIFVNQGCYCRTNKVTTKVGYNGGTTDVSTKLSKLTTPVTQTIDGVTYTFNYTVL